MLYISVHLDYNVVSVVVVRTIRTPLWPVKPLAKKNMQMFNALIPQCFCVRTDLLAGLSKPEISGFNTPMPHSPYIDTKVNPS